MMKMPGIASTQYQQVGTSTQKLPQRQSPQENLPKLQKDSCSKVSGFCGILTLIKIIKIINKKKISPSFFFCLDRWKLSRRYKRTDLQVLFLSEVVKKGSRIVVAIGETDRRG